jgi:hypothetical protein
VKGHVSGCCCVKCAAIEHGSRQGLNWHHKTRTPTCKPCREFGRLYQLERRLATASYRPLTFPLEVVVPDFDAHGLGAAFARGLRESA